MYHILKQLRNHLISWAVFFIIVIFYNIKQNDVYKLYRSMYYIHILFSTRASMPFKVFKFPAERRNTAKTYRNTLQFQILLYCDTQYVCILGEVYRRTGKITLLCTSAFKLMGIFAIAVIQNFMAISKKCYHSYIRIRWR